MNKIVAPGVIVNTTLIRGGTVVLGQSIARRDIMIVGETIVSVSDTTSDRLDADTIIDADGLLVLPGGVDTHVHFNDEFMGTVSVHDYYTGTLAAAFGGTTSVIDFSNPQPGGTLMSCIDKKLAEAEGKALIDFGVHPTVTQYGNRNLDETISQIPQVVERGSPTVKIYMTYRGEGLLMEEAEMRRVLTALRDAGGMMLVHAEDNDLAEKTIAKFLNSGQTAPIFHAESKPIDVENRANETCIRVARETGGRLFIVHMTTAEGPEAIAKARAEGVDIMGESCTHYLVFTDRMLRREDGMGWVCSPPLRDQHAQDALWQALADGRLSQVTSDDAAYSWAAKLMGRERFDLIPNGIPGIEPRFQLLYSEGVAKGRLSLQRFVEIVSTNPAKLFGMQKKGALYPGNDADIVLFDPNVRWTMNRKSSHMATDWTAYDEIEITGRIEKVFARGDSIVDGDELIAKPGRGRYLHRALDFNALP